jgi:hypothetical protein
MLTRAEIERLAAMGNALRPDWNIRSLCTLIHANLTARSYQDVAVALAWIGADTRTATPGRILELGPWWRASVDGTTPLHFERCPKPGHTSYAAGKCGACIADSKAIPDEAATAYQAPSIDADQRDVNERGIRRVRAALGQREDS